MSKILYVTQKLSVNSLNQIEIIKRSGHEFTIVTSQSEKGVGLTHSDTLYFFTRWNFIEFIKFLPSFMIINPDVVHVFVDSKSSGKTADFFASLSQIFKKIFSLQFFLSEEAFLKLPKAKKLVYLADVVTGPHRAFLYNLRGMQARNRYQIKGVIPPVLHLFQASTNSSALPNEIIEGQDLSQYQIIVPLKNVPADLNILVPLAKRFSLLFAVAPENWTSGDMKKFNHALTQNNCLPWRMFPVVSTVNLQSLPVSKLPLWIAGLDFELDECLHFFEFSLNRKIKINMDQTQARLYPDLWENNSMASVTNKAEILNFIAAFTLPEPGANQWVDSLNGSSLVDVSVNEFNRLISKATNTQNEKAV